MPPSSPDAKRQVIVVGGGGAGNEVAALLSKKLDPARHALTLLTARPFNVWLPSTPRMAVTSEGAFEEKVFAPYDRLLKGTGKVRTGRAIAVEEKTPGAGGYVVLQDGESVRYDVLVLAPGMRWDGPLAYPDTKEAALRHVREWREKFENAKTVVMAGGGPVNIEIAGEIKYYYPGNSVTIVQSGHLPLNKVYPDRFRSTVESRIRQRGVEFVFGDYLDETETKDGFVRTRKGKVLPADLVVSSTGGTPNTEFIKTLDSDIVTSYGRVRVDDKLQVLGHPGVFCIGDIVDNTERLGLNKYAPSHEYGGTTETISISMGKTGGAAYAAVLWGLIAPIWLVRIGKARTMGVNGARWRMGYGFFESLFA
ncbi:hypothetical protein EWM64_g7631 [Hericium alpestre]|uniref:FAD/NAD(P)-binding domain-containing protein n=1 Tax=Hericium alpestre TaxID=135208 RepID=A0A4Y9ZQ58_9AGAM|nr:hypothetical protein EWM64_g7631 [Hericium alpestre]